MSNQLKDLSRVAHCIRLLAVRGGILFALIHLVSEILHSQVRKMDGNHNLEIFSDAPIRKAVTMQVMPAVASQMITLVYNLADTYFVGMLNAPHETAAITVVYPSFLMLTAISNLFGVGGASAIARALGKQDEEGAKRISAISIWGGLLSSLLFSLLFLLLADPVLHLCGSTEDTYEIAFGYAKWVVVLGGPCTILNTLMANLIRAEGRAGAAAFGVSFGGILNIILDPLFVLPQFLGQGAVGGRRRDRAVKCRRSSLFPALSNSPQEKLLSSSLAGQSSVCRTVSASDSRYWFSVRPAVRAHRSRHCGSGEVRLPIPH